MSVASVERAELCGLFDAVGPNAPTLCSPWTTRDLLAHLLVRERRPDAALGIVIDRFAARTERVQAQIAEGSFPELVDRFRNGPPWWTFWAVPKLGDLANVHEFYVHHEDVRRAQPDWQPRPTDAARELALWRLLKLNARLLYRHCPGGVVLRSATHGEIRARSGEPQVVVVGEPSEIVLHAFGRPTELMRVVVQGDADHITAFNAATRGL